MDSFVADRSSARAVFASTKHNSPLLIEHVKVLKIPVVGWEFSGTEVWGYVSGTGIVAGFPGLVSAETVETFLGYEVLGGYDNYVDWNKLAEEKLDLMKKKREREET